MEQPEVLAEPARDHRRSSIALLDGIRWLIRLRWISAAALALAAVALSGLQYIAAALPGLEGAALLRVPYAALLAFAAGIATVNAVYVAATRGLTAHGATGGALRWFVHVQLGLDVVTVQAVAHATGGVESPVPLIAVFHVIVAASILTPRAALGVAAFAVATLAAVAGLEFHGVLPHHSLLEPAGGRLQLHTDHAYLAAYLLAGSAVLLTSVIVTTHFTQKVERSRQRLADRTLELSSFYNTVRLIGSDVDIEACLERVMSQFHLVHPITGYQLTMLDHASGNRQITASSGRLDGDGTTARVQLSAANRHIGVLTVGKASAHEFSEIEVSLLETIAANLALAAVNDELFRDLEREAMTDGLTGLTNHRELHRRLAQELARCERAERHLSVVMLDIDHFKRFNDRHGHLAGDQLLRELAALLSATVRTGDIVARYGGEEFALVLPEAGPDVARATAERVRSAVADHRFSESLPKSGRHVTVSAGLHTWLAGAPSIDRGALLGLADRALYAAKRAGRNRVEVS